MKDDRQSLHIHLETPPETARPFDDETWRRVERAEAIDGLLSLVQAVARVHADGFELHGIDRRDLAIDAATGRLYLVDTPRVKPMPPADTGHPGGESVWRDARLIGELAYENFMGEDYPGGHQMAALLQEREAMAQLGLLQPGLTQIVAACVSPYGELALLEMDDLARALEQLRRETTPQLNIYVGCGSTLGNYVFRRNNQDSCAFVTTQSLIGSEQYNLGFFCVADGIGGIRDGERASQLAVQTGCRAFGRALDHYGPRELARHPADFARAIVQVTSQRLALQGEFDPEHNRGGTTFTCLLLAGGRAGVGHVGDSRAVLVRDKRIVPLTRDHTLANILRELGEAPASEADAEMHNRTISRFLSTGMELDAPRIDGFSPEFVEFLADTDPEFDPAQVDQIGFQIQPDDLFILTSDGVHDELSPEKFRQLVTMHPLNPQVLVDAMIQQTLAQVGRDNATAMAILVR